MNREETFNAYKLSLDGYTYAEILSLVREEGHSGQGSREELVEFLLDVAYASIYGSIQ